MNPEETRLMATATEAAWFTAGDVDGFFGLFFSGFPDLLSIVGLAPVCGFPVQLGSQPHPARCSHFRPGRKPLLHLAGTPPGTKRKAQQCHRHPLRHQHAYHLRLRLPHHGPIYTRTHDANLAWHAGIFASLMSGIVETVGASCTDWLRRSTRAPPCSPR